MPEGLPDTRVDELVRKLEAYDMPHVPGNNRRIAIDLATRFNRHLLSAATPDALAEVAVVIDEDWRMRDIHHDADERD